MFKTLKKRKTKLNFLTMLISLLAISLVITPASQAKEIVKGAISYVGDTVHVEFSGLKQWNYKLDKKSKLVTLTIPAFDQKSITDFKTWNSQQVSDINIDTTGADNTYIVSFQLKDETIESFDYLTDEPSRLILDFYVDKEKLAKKNVKQKAVADARAKAKKKKISKIVNRTVYTKLDVKKRSPAGSELLDANAAGKNANNKADKIDIELLSGVFDAGDPDYKRFKVKDYEINEESIIASQQNIYLKFPMLEMSASDLKGILATSPQYSIKKGDSVENTQARLLMVLFNKGRNASYIKTYKLFSKSFPKSKYHKILKYMLADMHYKMWTKKKEKFHYDEAQKLYGKLLKKYPNSALAERTKLLLAYTELERGDGLNTIQQFNQFIKRFPNSKEYDRARFAIAEGYFFLNKFDAALDIYNNVSKDGRSPASVVEAKYRKGDVYFKKNSYKKAVSEYQSSIKKYPGFENKFPNANYNMAESYFWIGEYKKSLNGYLNFVRIFPKHAHNAFALTRIGEILDILGADKKRVLGAYMESDFRFQKSDGANIARVRVLSEQMKKMRDKELRKALKEFEEIRKSTKLPKIDEFVSLMITDGFRQRKEYDTALDYLVTYYQQNPTSANLDFFKKRIVGNIADSINEKIVAEDFVETIKIYDKYSHTWLRNDGRFDINYFLGRSYELAGVYSEARKIYKKMHKKINKIVGTREGLERKVNEHLPTVESTNLRLANVNLQMREYGEAYKYLKNIKFPKNLSHKEQVERVEVAAKVYEERGDLNKAIKFLKRLISEWDGEEELLSTSYVKLADLYFKNKQYDKAEATAQNAIDLNSSSDILSDDMAKALKTQGDAIFEQNRKMAAVEVYLKLLSQFEKQKPLDFVRYRVGEILFGENDLRGAEKIWLSLDEQKSSFYWKLAQEKLKDAKWQDDYSKYIKRIPAMSNVKK